MRIYILSDLHIYSAEDPVYRALLSFIEEMPKQGDVLVLAGDIFDLFIGGKEIFSKQYHLFFEQLKKTTDRGVEVHYIEGNHDFLLKSATNSLNQVQIHEESVELNRAGKRFLIVHGDLAHPNDYGYRLLRWFFRSFIFKIILLLMPNSWVDRLGKYLSQKSGQYNSRLMSDLPLDQQSTLRRIYRNFAAEKIKEGFDFVVMGHCHDLDEKLFQVEDRVGQYINVGYPRVHKTYLEWSSEPEALRSRIRREPFIGHI